MTKTTLDLSTLSNISSGTHSVTVEATAEGYIDSDRSNEITFTVKEIIPNAGYYITAAHIAYDPYKEETLYLKINDGEYVAYTNDGELLEFDNVKTVSFYYVSNYSIEMALYNTDGSYPDREDPSLSQGDFTSAISPETAKTITITEQSDLIFTIFERD